MKRVKILMGILMLIITTALVSATAITTNQGSTPGYISGSVFNGSYGSPMFNCTAMINGTPDQSIDNITMWTDFYSAGTMSANFTDASITNNTAIMINQSLPTTQGTYYWNCYIATNTSFYWANATNQSVIIDTTAPTLTMTAGTSTVPNGSVLTAGALGGLYFMTSDTGGSTVDEATSYANYAALEMTNASGGAKIVGVWSSQGEGHFEFDITTDLKGVDSLATTLCFNMNLTDGASGGGNVRSMTKYCVIWDGDPENNYASEYNVSTHGGTNLSMINVSDEGLITPIDVVINNTYGKVTISDYNFTGYDMNFNDCAFAQDSIMCPTDMGFGSTSIQLLFKSTSYSTEPHLYKDGVQYGGSGITWISGTPTYGVTVVGFSTYTLSSSLVGGSGGAAGGGSYAVCGDGVCNKPIETAEGCAIDCGQASIPVVNNPGGDGFVNLPVQPTPVATPEDDEGMNSGLKAGLWIGGTIIIVLIGLLLIVSIMPTKGKGRRKNRGRRYH